MYKVLKDFVQKNLKLKMSQLKNINLVCGKNLRIDWKTSIRAGNNKLVIGNNVALRSNHKGYHAGMPFPTTILIDKDGAECYIGDNCRINGSYIHAQKKNNYRKRYSNCFRNKYN